MLGGRVGGAGPDAVAAASGRAPGRACPRSSAPAAGPRPRRRSAGGRWPSPAHPRERHLDAALLAQQRHRLELQPVVVHRAPGARQEERALAAVGSAARPRQAPAVVERAAALRAARRDRPAACRRRWRSPASLPGDADRGERAARAGSPAAVDLEPRPGDITTGSSDAVRAPTAIGSARPRQSAARPPRPRDPRDRAPRPRAPA